MPRKQDLTMKNGVGYRGSSWFFVIRVTDPATGEKKQQRTSGFASRAEAEAAKAEAMAKRKRGRLYYSRRQTLDDYLDTWLEQHKPNVRPNTWAAYESKMRVHVRPYLGQQRLDMVTRADIKQWIASLLDAQVSPATIKAAHIALRLALKEAMYDDIIATNPCDGVRLPKQPKFAGLVPTDDHIAALLQVAQSHRLAVAFDLLVNTGARAGEVQGLRWADIDLQAGIITYRRSRTKANGETIENDTRKNTRDNAVALDAETLASLQRHKAAQAAERLQAGDLWVESGYVFTRANGEPLLGDALSQAFPQLRERAGWPKGMRLHSIRAWYGSMLHAVGMPVAVAAERMGYRDSTTYLNAYVRATGDPVAAAASAARQAIAGASVTKVLPRETEGHSNVRLLHTHSLSS
jgi:integrase